MNQRIEDAFRLGWTIQIIALLAFALYQLGVMAHAKIQKIYAGDEK